MTKGNATIKTSEEPVTTSEEPVTTRSGKWVGINPKGLINPEQKKSI